MSSLKSLVSNIEKENVLEKKKLRQLRTNPFSIPFDMKFPVIQRDCSDEKLQKRLVDTCRGIGDVQQNQTNVQASMTDWFMHETDTDFMQVCEIAIQLAYDNSPSMAIVSLMPYDCWGARYTKGNYTKSHEHWPQIWSWVYNVECCENCAPLIFEDASHQIAPIKGNMVLFPGWIRHKVSKQECDHERIILAGNLGMNPWQLITGMEKRNSDAISHQFKNMAEWVY